MIVRGGGIGVGKDLHVLAGEPSVPPQLLLIDNAVVTVHYAGRAPELRAAATA